MEADKKLPEMTLWLTDARGKKSKTLTFVAWSWGAVMVKFLIGGLTLGNLGISPVMTGTEFGIAIGAILGIWTAREFGDKGIVGNKS
ncbi:MAG: hypothetical protein NUV80_03825 [Candidatus Berkelbacteria bacterium]|nr:hypothetical protein [Candidatus Berkelbacteria bacterium]